MSAHYSFKRTIIFVAAFLLVSTAALPAAEIRHRFLAMDESGRQVVHVDENDAGKNWTIPLKSKFRDIQLIGGGKIMIAGRGGYREYDLRTRKLLKEYAPPRDGAWKKAVIEAARRLPDGRTVLGLNAPKGITVVELDSSDRELRRASFAGTRTLRLMRMTPRGTVLFTTAGKPCAKLVEGSLDGSVVRTIPLDGIRYGYQALVRPEGGYVVSAGYAGKMLFLDAQGAVTRAVGEAAKEAGLKTKFFAGFQVLKNGDVVVCNWLGHKRKDARAGPQLLQFTPDGTLVWRWHDPKFAGCLDGIIILDDLDTSVLNDDSGGVLGAVGK